MMKNNEKNGKSVKICRILSIAINIKKNGWKPNRLICNDVIFNIKLMHQLLISRAIILTILRAAFAL